VNNGSNVRAKIRKKNFLLGYTFALQRCIPIRIKHIHGLNEDRLSAVNILPLPATQTV